MKHLRKNGGFTLIEMVVCIAIASLVTMAATTVLMLALRVNRQTSDTATQQYTVRALLNTMERAATTGDVKKVVSNLGSWELLNDDNEETPPIFEYVAFDRQILSNGIVVMEDVYASNAILENGLLSISIETKEGIFESTIYCRVSVEQGEGESNQPTAPSNPTTKLDKFLVALLGELNSSGMIQNGPNKGKYYSQWYIWPAPFGGEWNPSTPWCACFVSWALEEAGLEGPAEYITQKNGIEISHGNWFSDVDEFVVYLQKENKWQAQPKDGSITPNPGDLVFFDWITNDGVDDPQHVGVVLCLTDSNNDGVDDSIITIEGNSAGRVAVRSYQLDDSRILGYGILNWS